MNSNSFTIELDETTLTTDSDTSQSSNKTQDLVPISFHCLRTPQRVLKHNRMKPKMKGSGNTTAILCNVRTYVEFLEVSLCMHSYFHYSADLPHEIRSDLDVYRTGLQEYIKLFSMYFYRGDSSVDTDTCKVHCFLHSVSNTKDFGDPMQYESGKGERGLKEWAKSVSVTAQKTGIDIFIYQTVQRVADRLLLKRASDNIDRKHVALSPISNTSCPSIDTEDTAVASASSSLVKKRKHPHCRYYTQSNKLFSVDRTGKETLETTACGPVPACVLNALFCFEKQSPYINIWGEWQIVLDEKLKVVQHLRASTSFDKFGPFFDWVSVKFDMDVQTSSEDDDVSTNMSSVSNTTSPAKLLCLYEDAEGNPCALVNSVEYSTGKESKVGNTRLITNHVREFQSTGWPTIRKISVEDIMETLYVVERMKLNDPVPPRLVNRRDRNKYVVSVVTPRKQWAMLFYEWAREQSDRPRNDDFIEENDSEDEDSDGD